MKRYNLFKYISCNPNYFNYFKAFCEKYHNHIYGLVSIIIGIIGLYIAFSDQNENIQSVKKSNYSKNHISIGRDIKAGRDVFINNKEILSIEPSQFQNVESNQVKLSIIKKQILEKNDLELDNNNSNESDILEESKVLVKPKDQ